MGSAGLSDAGALETLCHRTPRFDHGGGLHWANVPAALLVTNACATYFKEPDLTLHDPGRGKFGGWTSSRSATPEPTFWPSTRPHQAPGTLRRPGQHGLLSPGVSKPQPAVHAATEEREAPTRWVWEHQAPEDCAVGASHDTGILGARGALVTAPSGLGSRHPGTAGPQGGGAGQALHRGLPSLRGE